MAWVVFTTRATKMPGRSISSGGISPGSTISSTSTRSEEHTSELQSLRHLVCRLLLEKKKNQLATNPRDLAAGQDLGCGEERKPVIVYLRLGLLCIGDQLRQHRISWEDRTYTLAAFH